MTELTEKQVIEKTRFLIRDAERGGASSSFLAPWHRENVSALRELLSAYVQLNTLEREAFRQTGLPLSELLNVAEDKPAETMFRAKNIGRGKR